MTESPDGGATAAFDAGSFRDRESRVFRHGDGLYRALSPTAWEAWQALEGTAFFRRVVEAGRLVETRALEPAEADALELAPGDSWQGFLEHRQVPFVSYPFEWSFHMLRRAALEQLDLHLEALEDGLTLKDASAYNLQWRGARPLFIDIGSFEPYRDGEPWVGYLQFCRLFLYPLLLTSLKGVAFQPWLRGCLDGIPPREMAGLMSFKERFSRGVFTHVYLHAKLQARAEGARTSVKGELKRAGFSKEILRTNLRAMRKVVARLDWSPGGSTWADYAETGHSYDQTDLEAKRTFVREAAESAPGGRWTRVWDLGANTGRFSELVAPHADTVLALDGDHLAVDRMFRRLEENGPHNILPLVLDLADPSPGLGWRGRERRTLADRGGRIWS